MNDRIGDMLEKLGVPLNNETVLCEGSWNDNTENRFYESYRDSVLIVVFFDANYNVSEGAYPEWQIVERNAPSFHERILPANFDSDFRWKIMGQNHYLGKVDLHTCKDDNERLTMLLPIIVNQWVRIITPWINMPPRNTVLCFSGQRPPAIDSATACIELPGLDQQHIGATIGMIERGSIFQPVPLRSACIYGSSECLPNWSNFERVISHISQASRFYRRTSVPIPVFIPDEIADVLPKTKSLRDLIYRKNSSDLEIQNAWENEYRLSSSFDDWLNDINARPLINIITNSQMSRNEILSQVTREIMHREKELILNLWPWRDGFMYPKNSPFEIDTPGIFYAAKEAGSEHPMGSNFLHESDELECDRNCGARSSAYLRQMRIHCKAGCWARCVISHSPSSVSSQVERERIS